MDLGKFIKEKREKKGYNLKEFSKLLRISELYLDEIERNIKVPSSILIINIIKNLNVTKDEYVQIMNLIGTLKNEVPPDIKDKLINSSEDIYNKVRGLLCI